MQAFQELNMRIATLDLFRGQRRRKADEKITGLEHARDDFGVITCLLRQLSNQ
ncbi:hypothetical protein D3C76_1707910 [compost metagenome]